MRLSLFRAEPAVTKQHFLQPNSSACIRAMPKEDAGKSKSWISMRRDKGGIKDITFVVKGKGAYNRLKYEGGTHRVQRVPVTEASGRIHTSTAKVIVLPEADEDIQIDIKENDIRVDVYRSTGHGGQSVNTTDSAVRITHLPTGLVVTCQDEKSQLKNKLKALTVLKARLWDLQEAQRQEELSKTRRSQVQTGDRSEKIRTYNFPQDRVTDHRIGLTRHNLPDVLNGELDEFIDTLITVDQADKLQHLFEEEEVMTSPKTGAGP